MRRSKFTEEQIIGILQEAEAGVAVATVCRKHGISDGSFYKWRAKFGGLEISEAKRLRALISWPTDGAFERSISWMSLLENVSPSSQASLCRTRS